MQVEHSSKYNMFMGGGGGNKCSTTASSIGGGSNGGGSASSSSSSSVVARTAGALTPLRSLEEQQASGAPKVQYLTPTCILFTYDDGDVGSLLDEHFRKSLNSGGKAPPRHRNLPPSFWNRHYARTQRASSTALAAAAAAASMSASPGGAASSAAAAHSAAAFGYYPDAYSSLLRSHQQTAALCWPSYGAAAASHHHHQALAAAVSGQQTPHHHHHHHQSSVGMVDGASTSRDLSTQAAAAAYGLSSAEASLLNGHMNEAVHAYNPFLSLTRPTAANAAAGFVPTSRLPAPPQYSNIRNDWTSGLATADTVARDFSNAHTYQFSGLHSASSSHHFPIVDANQQHKDALCYPQTQ